MHYSATIIDIIYNRNNDGSIAQCLLSPLFADVIFLEISSSAHEKKKKKYICFFFYNIIDISFSFFLYKYTYI
jgi:hypothetical protein